MKNEVKTAQIWNILASQSRQKWNGILVVPLMFQKLSIRCSLIFFYLVEKNVAHYLSFSSPIYRYVVIFGIIIDGNVEHTHTCTLYKVVVCVIWTYYISLIPFGANLGTQC